MTGRSRNSRGFTLIELQLAAGLSLIIIVAAIALYIQCWRMFGIGNASLDIYLNSKLAMSRMARDARSAALILSDFTSGGNSYTTSSSCIVLQVPSIDATGKVITDQYDVVVYMLGGTDGTYLRQLVIPNMAIGTPSARQAQDHTVARYCSALTFYYINASAGTWQTLSAFISGGGNLSDVNDLGIFLPLREITGSLTGQGTTRTSSLTPTSIIKLRNRN